MIKYKAKNSLKSPRFAGVKTFMRMEHVVTTDDIDFAVVGIPYDTCASFRVGTRRGLPRSATPPPWRPSPLTAR